MVSAAFLAVPSLWGIQSATISGSIFALQEITNQNKNFLQASNITHFKIPTETIFDEKEWGSLGCNNLCQVQIEQQQFQRNVNYNFKFGLNKDEVQACEKKTILFFNATYLD